MFVDLSVLVTEETPVYPGDPSVVIKQGNNFERSHFVDHAVTLGTHSGTHVDAPMHMLPNGVSLASIPIEQFIGTGKIIDVRNHDFTAIKNNDIRPADIVLFYTGMSEHYNDPSYFQDYPAMSEEIAEYLVKKQIKMVGIDTCSIDNLQGFPIHKIFLNHNICIIENLVNLKTLVNKSFSIFCLPLNIALDGAPARVVAEIHS